ncbi:MAG TPA: helix-turn-helix domain-containing protein [Solirubrobacteraceae bacterium]|jgi:transcriptional regulator with XRE-family HTH domain|nr:helix-turn-helix domain-containing protein [Solirubrobacteraceae bacterium]
MTDIGPMLREARMHAGLDITDVEERTKVRAKYLRALENEEWSLLPGTAFTKGFLRSYAELLGLDARLLIDEYKRQWEVPHELAVNPVRPTIGPELRDRGRARRGRWVAMGASVVVIALALVLVGHLFGPASTSGGDVNHGSALGGATKGPSNGPTGATTATLTSCAETAGGGTPTGCVSLRIEPVAALYVCLVGDERVRIDGHTLARAAGPFHAHKFVLTLGSDTATLVVNGRRKSIPTASGALRYSITAKRLTREVAPRQLRCGV